jgi:outer membrane biosynthesis protein TonB
MDFTLTTSFTFALFVCTLRLMLGFMLPTWFLSMWISNTATTAMMIPIMEAVLEQLRTAGEDISQPPMHKLYPQTPIPTPVLTRTPTPNPKPKLQPPNPNPNSSPNSHPNTKSQTQTPTSKHQTQLQTPNTTPNPIPQSPTPTHPQTPAPILFTSNPNSDPNQLRWYLSALCFCTATLIR